MKRSILFSLLALSSAWADPIWHCSRNVPEQNTMNSQAHSEEFSIASFNSSAEVIGVSISDLIDVYSGIPVRIGGMPLSACFMSGNDTLSKTALTSLGLQLSTIQALSKKSAIVQTNLHLVATEGQMVLCIEKHFPAVGYLNEPKETNKLQPCF
jgi:hypothetical protein